MTDDNASGRKYFRAIRGQLYFISKEGQECIQQIDVYAVIETFGLTCPARQHALKKILLAGERGKNGTTDDLKEARDAITRAIELEEGREVSA